MSAYQADLCNCYPKKPYEVKKDLVVKGLQQKGENLEISKEKVASERIEPSPGLNSHHLQRESPLKEMTIEESGSLAVSPERLKGTGVALVMTRLSRERIWMTKRKYLSLWYTHQWGTVMV